MTAPSTLLACVGPKSNSEQPAHVTRALNDMNRTDQSSNVTATRLQREVGRILRRVAKSGEHVTVEHNGFPIVVIVPLSDYVALVQNARRPDAGSSGPVTSAVETAPA